MCKSLYAVIKETIAEALSSAGVALAALTDVVLLGASTRMPGIHTCLQVCIAADVLKVLL